jgi:hypothetical protein
VSAVDSNGKTIFVADAHRDDGKRLVVRADEKLTAFVELESAIRAALGSDISTSACAECLIPASTDAMQEGRIDDQFAKRIDGPHVEWREAAYAADIDP